MSQAKPLCVRFKEIQLMDEVEDLKTKDILDLDKSFRVSSIIAVALSIIVVVVWPLLTLPAGVFSEVIEISSVDLIFLSHICLN